MQWHQNRDHVDHDRPSWEDTYLGIAHTIAKRSHDAQTGCGCVIVSEDKRVLGMGYNGFLAGIWDDILPNTRPEKYPWMLHSEVNAILNCTHRPEGGTVYVTGHPCLHCFMCMCQVGIKEIVYDINHSINMVNPELIAQVDVVRWLTAAKVKVTPYDYKG
jgi:dCMP deaminase